LCWIRTLPSDDLSSFEEIATINAGIEYDRIHIGPGFWRPFVSLKNPKEGDGEAKAGEKSRQGRREGEWQRWNPISSRRLTAVPTLGRQGLLNRLAEGDDLDARPQIRGVLSRSSRNLWERILKKAFGWLVKVLILS
jgi:hypothetical protein